MKKKLIRISTVPMSLSGLLTGQLKYMSTYFEVVGISSKDGNKLQNVTDQEKIRTIPVEIRRQISPLHDLITVWHLYKVLKKEKPHIVHSLTPKAGLLGMIASKLAGVPNRLHTFTGLIFPTKKGLIKRVLICTDKILCYCATQIHPEGQGVKNDLINYKITSKPLKVVGNGNINGININHFNIDNFKIDFISNLKKEFNISKNDYVFVFIGRLVKDKGINELITAFNELNIEQAKLLLVGDYEHHLDPLEKETIDIISKNKNIISTGWVDDVRPYFAISDILVFPSYREGFPNVVIQAGAMGLPSIVTDINGANEIIIPNENGIIIPSMDKDELKDAMLKFYNKDIVIDSNTCRALIVNRYEQSILWKAQLHEYQTLK
ncbi:glycosyltransferase family 4 protein [Algibacter lectus]|uniref:Glycosyltransferase involved in cell wall biosynthesis n=1 Tax=Algibacter lectus TaxID=221126 RepID=A0A4V3HH24_9FLAO|nr:glycosyltransferase family 4 protein [Algibacter lectus]MWW23658.1 glycosyltransferase [Algibacter lectus]TDY63661.1 glycosyltransferase involved in cell wall biosynthesis [Algibacter lectus]